jgi:elongation factor P--beta-lysine ligase
LPVYARDAQVFVGTIEQLEVWLRGVEWARQYDMLLRVSDDKKRKRKEQDERNRQLVQRLKNEEIVRRTK